MSNQLVEEHEKPTETTETTVPNTNATNTGRPPKDDKDHRERGGDSDSNKLVLVLYRSDTDHNDNGDSSPITATLDRSQIDQ